MDKPWMVLIWSQASIKLRRIESVEMAGFIDGEYPDLIVRYLYFIDTAGRLRQSPIRGKRKIGELQEKRTIHAVV